MFFAYGEGHIEDKGTDQRRKWMLPGAVLHDTDQYHGVSFHAELRNRDVWIPARSLTYVSLLHPTKARSGGDTSFESLTAAGFVVFVGVVGVLI